MRRVDVRRLHQRRLLRLVIVCSFAKIMGMTIMTMTVMTVMMVMIVVMMMTMMLSANYIEGGCIRDRMVRVIIIVIIFIFINP